MKPAPLAKRVAIIITVTLTTVSFSHSSAMAEVSERESRNDVKQEISIPLVALGAVTDIFSCAHNRALPWCK